MKRSLLRNVLLLLLLAGRADAQWHVLAPLRSSTDDVIFSTKDTGIACYTERPYTWERDNLQTTTVLQRTTNGAQSWQELERSSAYGKGVAAYKVCAVKNSSLFYYVHRFHDELQIDRIDKHGKCDRITAGDDAYIGFSAPDTAHWFLLSKSGKISYISAYNEGHFHYAVDSFRTVNPALLDFPDASSGYIAASAPDKNTVGIILRYSGNGWQQVFSDSTVNIHALFFLSPTTGYAACGGGLILKTTDGGQHWEYITTELSVAFYSIYFANEQHGYASGSNGTIITTTDGGNTWKQSAAGTSYPVTKIFSTRDSAVLALSNDMLYTNNKRLMEKNAEFVQIVKIAYHYQQSGSIEMGYFLGFESHLSSWGGGWLYGPSASAEMLLKRNEARRTVIAPKIGLECYDGNIIGRFCGIRCCAAYYTDGGKQGSLKLEPEAGLSLFMGILNVFYGYNIPLSNASFAGNNGSKVTMIFNVPYRFTEYRNPHKWDFL